MIIIASILNKLFLPFSSRYKYTKQITDLEQKRMAVCKTCIYNSDNVKNKKFKDKVFLFLNKFTNLLFGISVSDTSTCTLCGCDLRFKSMQKEKENWCEIGKWDNIS